jgi:RNA polymerase sigma-70 factor, ECF subfamily
MNSKRPLAARLSERRTRSFMMKPRESRAVARRQDGRLLSTAKNGDRDAFGELCRIHRPSILRIARRITGNLEDAQDAVQDSLLRAYLAIRSFNERAKFRTWLTRITINSCLMLLRKRRLISVVSPDANGSEWGGDEVAELVAPEHNPEDSFLLLERRHAVRNAVEGLPDILRIVIEAGHLEDRAPVEIAGALGISHGAAKARQFRAIAALRKSRCLLEIGRAAHSALDCEDAA